MVKFINCILNIYWKLNYKYSTNRSCILPGIAHIGRILKVYPINTLSPIKKPYLVQIVSTWNGGFKTKLLDEKGHKNPHIRTFLYNSYEWRSYHQFRFKIMDLNNLGNYGN